MPTLDGPVTIRVKPGTQSGTVLRVGGRGVKNGALLVTLDVKVPTELDDAAIVHVDTPQRVKVPGEPDTVLTLNHINFIANKAELTEAAWDALPSNVANLRHFSDRYLEIDGYCNQPGPPLAKTDVLFILSVNRAKYIYHYLITQGFDPSHLSYKGLGNASPVNAHPTTTSEMDQNMRVEVKVFRDPPKPVATP